MTDAEKISKMRKALLELTNAVSTLNNTNRALPMAMLAAYSKSFEAVDNARDLLELIPE